MAASREESEELHVSDLEEGKISENKKPGIVYFSRLPPFMKPAKVRYIFSQYGEIGRLFLQPEDPMVRKRRKKHGGNKGKCFTEGWLEFQDKKLAQSVALSLNNTIVGGKKKSYYHDDIWNIKFLPKFKWSHLSEKIAYQKAVREQRMRTEISQAKREANFYLENVDKNKALRAINERKRKQNSEATGIKLAKLDLKVPSEKEKFVEKVKLPKVEPVWRKKPQLSTSLLKKIFTGGSN